jgi:competence ComEA-like helix-hairpin-helix protein
MKSLSVKERMQAFVQSALGCTKQEFVILMLFLFGGLSGMIIRRTGTISLTGMRASESMDRVNHTIDSILKAEDARVDSMLMGSLKHDSMPSLLDRDIGVHFPKKADKKPTIIDLNSASKAALMNLPGIGESTAEKIIDYRKDHAFMSIEDIMNVKGIGEKKFEKMKQYLRIGKKTIKSSNQ